MSNEEIIKEFNIKNPKQYYTCYEISRILKIYPMNILNWFKENKFKAIVLPSGIIRIPHNEIPTLNELKKERCFYNEKFEFNPHN